MTTDLLIRKITKQQIRISQDVEQLKAKMRMLGSLRRFEEIAKRGRAFARKRKIKSADVLKDD